MRKSESAFIKSLFLLIIILIISVYSSAAFTAPEFSLHGEGDKVYRLEDFKGKPLILFFFSFSCGHCERVMPVIKELYKNSNGRYNILGIVYGTPKEDLKYKIIETGTVFPVAIGTESVRKDYKVSGTPHLWVIGPVGTIKERFVGEKGAGLLKDFLEAQAKFNLQEQVKLYKWVGLFELVSDSKIYEGKDIEIGGLLIQTSPSYFPKPVFMITNGADKIRVSSWLPLEVAPSPKGLKKQRKEVMSDFLDKYVIISGKVVLEDGRPVIEVKDGNTE